jgi:hypothetical protein
LGPTQNTKKERKLVLKKKDRNRVKKARCIGPKEPSN